MALSEHGKKRYEFAIDIADEVYARVLNVIIDDPAAASTMAAAVMAEIGRAESTDRICGLLDRIGMELSDMNRS